MRFASLLRLKRYTQQLFLTTASVLLIVCAFSMVTLATTMHSGQHLDQMSAATQIDMADSKHVMTMAQASPTEGETAEALQQACDSGQAESCSRLAELYERGKEVNKDFAKAHTLYLQSCDAGFPKACFSAAFNYQDGRNLGGVKDIAKALALYKKSCDGGYASGCNSLGLAYAFGEGVRQDLVKAASLYQKGCDLGSNAACQ